MLDRYRYIVIEGPIGVGKTALARKFADYLDAELVTEDVGNNPFLGKFYQDVPRYAFSTQISFLLQRVQKVEGLAQMDLFNRPTVADFLLDKDPLFAALTLNDDELRLYRQIYQHLKLQAPTPDLIIYLQASFDWVWPRLHQRGDEFERIIPEGYLRRLIDSYNQFFYEYTAAPVLTVNREPLNFIDRDDDFGLLLHCINGMRGQREFFNTRL